VRAEIPALQTICIHTYIYIAFHEPSSNVLFQYIYIYMPNLSIKRFRQVIEVLVMVSELHGVFNDVDPSVA
jgi:hypothetical protein